MSITSPRFPPFPPTPTNLNGSLELQQAHIGDYFATYYSGDQVVTNSAWTMLTFTDALSNAFIATGIILKVPSTAAYPVVFSFDWQSQIIHGKIELGQVLPLLGKTATVMWVQGVGGSTIVEVTAYR